MYWECIAASAGVFRIFNTLSSNGLEYSTKERVSVNFVETTRYFQSSNAMLATLESCEVWDGVVLYLLLSNPIILDVIVCVYGSCLLSGSFELFKYDDQDIEFEHDNGINK